MCASVRWNCLPFFLSLCHTQLRNWVAPQCTPHTIAHKCQRRTRSSAGDTPWRKCRLFVLFFFKRKPSFASSSAVCFQRRNNKLAQVGHRSLAIGLRGHVLSRLIIVWLINCFFFMFFLLAPPVACRSGAVRS